MNNKNVQIGDSGVVVLKGIQKIFEELKQETLEAVVYRSIGLAADEQGIINQALATSNVMEVLCERGVK